MGAIDITQNRLEDHADVFADICNVLLFGGESVILPESLKETGRTSQYKADDGSIHQEDRDVSKYWQEGRVRISLLGLENQVKPINYMPHRVIGYDGASYRSQILGKEPHQMYPVVTIVLYFGMTPWNKPKSLFEEMAVSEYLKPYVNDYKINLFEIAFLKPEQVQLFKSDFREVADYFVQKRTNKKYVPSKRTLKHKDEILKFMAAVSGDDRFVSIKIPQEKGVVTMCDIVDGFVSQGISQGLSQGIAQGLSQGDARTLIRCVDSLMEKDNITASEACEKLGYELSDYENAQKFMLEEA